VGKLNQIFGGKGKDEQMTTDQLALIVENGVQKQEDGMYRLESMMGKSDFRFERLEEGYAAIIEKYQAMEKMLMSIGNMLSSNNAQSVVREFEDSEETKTKLAEINEVSATLNEVFVSVLSNGNVKLYEFPSGKKRVPRLTEEGDRVYEMFGEVVITLANILGIKKEVYQNRGKFLQFYKGIGIKPLTRSSIVRKDGKPITTVWATIIREGHAKEYANYLRKFIDEAKKEVI
jgi:hypothetical protein